MSATAYTNEAMQAPEHDDLGRRGYVPLQFYKRPVKVILSRLDYANAEAAGFDMDQFEVAKPRYVRC